MALSITELELQSTEYLPAREVMTGLSLQADPDPCVPDDGEEPEPPVEPPVMDDSDGDHFEGGILNGLHVHDVLTDINVEDVQVGLANVMVDDITDTLDLGTANEDDIIQLED